MATDIQTVLVVDDTPENIDVLVGTLKGDYKVKAATNGEMALKVVHAEAPDIVLLDIMMPGIDGYEICRRLKSDPTTRRIPVIFITAKIGVEDEMKGLELGAVDYITKPISPPIVKARVKTHLALYDQNRALEQKVQERTAELHETRLQIIRRLGRAAEFKDNETGMHVIRMSHYARIIGKAIGMDDAEADLLLNAVPMHDVGKIGIPDKVLLKPGRLDRDEWVLMKRHAEFGAIIIGEHHSELLQMARTVALTHHEKWDGNGYPQGLAGEDIPLAGRIAAVADVFDALTTQRPYKEAWSVDMAVELIRSEAGQHFDPGLVEAFTAKLDKMLTIKKRYAENSPSARAETDAFAAGL